jgi:acyl-CoA hydrolase
MEIRVDTYVEALNRERRLVNRAYLVEVARDENEQPVKVPSLLLETEEERREWEEGKKRHELRKQNRTKVHE